MVTLDLVPSLVSRVPDGTPPGAIFLTKIEGWRGRSASAAQAFTRGGAPYTHCGIYVGDGNIVQAEWHGARLRTFAEMYAGDREVLWSDAPIRRHLATLGGDEVELRRGVVRAALAMVGSPYGLSTMATVAAAEWHVPGWQRLYGWSVQHGRHICSTLIAQAFRLGGIPVFDDRTVVTPGDLFRLDEAWTRSRLADLESRVAAIEEKIA